MLPICYHIHRWGMAAYALAALLLIGVGLGVGALAVLWGLLRLVAWAL